jgi:aminoglycoside phosphotransferase (APT) family kinase protein
MRTGRWTVTEPRPPRITAAAARRACADLLGVTAAVIEYPGGDSRSSVRAVAAGKSFIVTRRRHATRAALEAGVLAELHAAGAPVPAVLAFDGKWLLQEDLGGRRLSAALGTSDMRAAAIWAERAVGALLRCQQAADEIGLARRVAPIGASHGWRAGLLALPGDVAALLGLPAPDLSDLITAEQLEPRRLAFVKWDARPGNALLVDGGAEEARVGWIDWEHCGARDALDDFAWLLCDEYMPDDAQLEATLFERFLPAFARLSGRSPEDALLYLSRFGILHTCMRLRLILEHKGEGDWWDADYCERTDRIGVTAEGAGRLCARGARWSRRLPAGERMARFFMDVDEGLQATRMAPRDASPGDKGS